MFRTRFKDIQNTF